MAAVFPETVVMQENGNYKAYFVDANENVTMEEITPEEFAKMIAWSYEHFGRAPNTKVIG